MNTDNTNRGIRRNEECGCVAEEKKREGGREEGKPERPNFRRQYN